MIVPPHTDQGAAPGQPYRWLRWLRVSGLGKGDRGHRLHPGPLHLRRPERSTPPCGLWGLPPPTDGRGDVSMAGGGGGSACSLRSPVPPPPQSSFLPEGAWDPTDDADQEGRSRASSGPAGIRTPEGRCGEGGEGWRGSVATEREESTRRSRVFCPRFSCPREALHSPGSPRAPSFRPHVPPCASRQGLPSAN